MNSSYSIEKAVEYFASLPSIGRKTAQRLVFHILKQPKEYIEDFSNTLISLGENVKMCSLCFSFTDVDPCPICTSTRRDPKIICVVEEPKVITALERTNEFSGKYHVLHGLLNPLDGIGPDDLRIRELVSRLSGVDEVILALNPSVEGEITMQYIAKMFENLPVKVTRLASGVPIGSSLEFSDEATLCRALENRVKV